MSVRDGHRSRAVLIGTSRYSEAQLPDLLAVERNVSDLADILCADHGLELSAENCIALVDEKDPRAVLSAVTAAAEEAEDLLLVYYAGHGLLDRHGDLFLALVDSPTPLEDFWQAVDIRHIRRIMTDRTPAANRVLILDCCFSGRAFEAMGAAESVIEAMGVNGTFTMTSTSENEKAHAPEGAPYTAFTGALIEMFDVGVPDGPEYLTLDIIYENIKSILRSRGLPEPKRRCVDGTGEFTLVRNRAWSAGSPIDSDRVAATPGARFRELSAHPAYKTIRRLVGWYVRECIPDPQANKRDRWNVTALPSVKQSNGRRLLTLNCGLQEVMFISEVIRPNGSRQIIVVCNIAPPLDRSTAELSFYGGNVFGRPMSYERLVWAWQFDLVDNPATLRGSVSFEEFTNLARQLNGDLMQERSPNARFHNSDLAEDLFAAGRELAAEKRLPFDMLHLVIARSDIESGDIGPTLLTLRQMISSREYARAAQGILDLRIDGYDETDAELSEIDAVRSFMRALDDEFPYWLYFSNTHTSSLQMIALCFLPPFLTREGKKQHFGPRLGRLLLDRWIPALNSVADFAGLNDDELRARSDEAIGYFNGPQTEILH